MLYGRAVEAPNNSDATTPTTTAVPSYAVSAALPNGWGSANVRLSFYKTPLIVSCSVILAVLIVIAIIFIALQRRKVTRRRKRHQARMRRKALAAAGLTEDTVQDATSEVALQFSQRLAEFEKAHKAKRRGGGRHNSSYVRTKVRVWHKGVRHRRPRDGGDQGGEKDGVAFTSGHELGRERSAGSMTTQSTVSLATTASSPPTRQRSLDHDTTPSHSPPTLPTEASDAHVSDANNSDCPPDSSSSSEHQSPRAEAQSSPETSAHDPPVNPTGGHLPPAYRPASVRSVQVGSSSGPSTLRAPRDENTPSVLTPEKVAAAGYYPAPATADAEAAQAVAHRADAKAPIVVPPDEEERREQAMRHVATDDKRELDRLRHGASAPPVTRVDDDDAGPSAPSFGVDETGFETLPLEEEDGPSAPPPQPSTPSGLPAPPQRTQQRSLPADDVGDDTSHLLPSAPPVEAPDRLPSAPPLEIEPSAPSAPPLPDLDEESEEGHGPSAPPLEPDPDDHDEETQRAHEEQADGESPGGTGHVNESLGVNGVRYLPVYEP
ncbi:hypothetical protein Q8F55_003510 [Vanrija albida]|uniref:Proteophosphoglycan ppg4 n=1 Tax=Vanrija albida TaxID=181172 RepID=A0ABR3Q471_9TREE